MPPPRPHRASESALPKPVAGGQVPGGGRNARTMARDAMTTLAYRPEIYAGRRSPASPSGVIAQGARSVGRGGSSSQPLSGRVRATREPLPQQNVPTRSSATPKLTPFSEQEAQKQLTASPLAN